MLTASISAFAAFFALALAVPAPSSGRQALRRHGQSLSEHYIVTLKADSDFPSHKTFVTDVHKRSLMRRGLDSYEGLTREYQSTAFRGYAGHFDGEALAEIKARHEVEYIEPQQYFYPWSIAQQPNVPSYGLAQISTQNATGTTYYFDDSAGMGSTIYVVDTGVNIAHEDFEGRARHGYTVDKKSGDDDQEGHGTHVAGTAAGATFGVAKAANIVAVKLSVDGEEGFPTSNCLDGIEWAVKDVVNNKVKNAVINLSIGGGYSAALNAIVNAAFDAGINVIVAAGNENQTTEMVSPAAARKALTVGAVDRHLNIADYSNYGAEVDIFAPGTAIWSASNTDNTGAVKLDGTSMATPHVAGLIAYLRVLENLDAEQATGRILQLAHHRVIKGVPAGTVNLLAYNGAGYALAGPNATRTSKWGRPVQDGGSASAREPVGTTPGARVPGPDVPSLQEPVVADEGSYGEVDTALDSATTAGDWDAQEEYGAASEL